MSKTIGIYLIKNNINDHCYVGQSINIEKRWKDHKRCKDNFPIYNAFRKYGIENFTFTVLLECTVERLNYYESAYISEYNSHCDGYNCNEGGQLGHGGMKGRKASEETKMKISKANKGRVFSEEHKLNISESAKHRKYNPKPSIETRIKMSEAQKKRQQKLKNNEESI